MHIIGKYYTKSFNHYDDELKEIEVSKKVVKNTDYEQQCKFFVKEDTNEIFAYENEYCDKKLTDLDYIIVEHDLIRNKTKFINFKTFKEYIPKSDTEVNYILKRNLEIVNINNKERYYKFLTVMDLKDKLAKENIEPEEKYVIKEYINQLNGDIEAGDNFRDEKMLELRKLYELRKESKNE